MALYFDDSNYKGDYETSVVQRIEGAIESWEEEVYLEYEDSEIKDQIQQFAQLLLQSCVEVERISDLVSVFRELSTSIRTAEECDSPSWVEYGEHELAKESVGMLAVASGRIWKLLVSLFLLEESELNDHVLKYLRRVLRCYIWGFDPECIIMCRSVIEKAIADTVPFEICLDILGPRRDRDKERWYTFQDRIVVAKKKGIITEGVEDLIEKIRQKGNKAVHNATWLTEDLLASIKDTCKVIAVLKDPGA